MQPKPADPLNNGTPPTCGDNCKYAQTFDGYDLQRNALRIESASMVCRVRCGWNIKPDRIGGRPLDYEPCVYVKNL